MPAWISVRESVLRIREAGRRPLANVLALAALVVVEAAGRRWF